MNFSIYHLPNNLTLCHPAAFEDFWKKHLNACGFAWEYLHS